jgi:hypothetical protein
MNHEFEEMIKYNLKVKNRVFDLAREQVVRYFDHIGFRVNHKEQSNMNQFNLEMYSLDQEYENFIHRVKVLDDMDSID